MTAIQYYHESGPAPRARRPLDTSLGAGLDLGPTELGPRLDLDLGLCSGGGFGDGPRWRAVRSSFLVARSSFVGRRVSRHGIRYDLESIVVGASVAASSASAATSAASGVLRGRRFRGRRFDALGQVFDAALVVGRGQVFDLVEVLGDVVFDGLDEAVF